MENAGSEIPTLCQQLLYCTKIGVLVNIGVKMPAIVVTVTGLGVFFLFGHMNEYVYSTVKRSCVIFYHLCGSSIKHLNSKTVQVFKHID